MTAPHVYNKVQKHLSGTISEKGKNRAATAKESKQDTVIKVALRK